ncbi:DNA invertase Pin-like site-specific DNA recombinase [Sinorhizobium meliloti]|uniref:recombinase family protein n=1 Tax=Rhizobium meliloti TaxID=382 RepID=UPI0027D97333|nr:recombinase family protein [Sinorhizobium meliloti]MBP2464822.1 DNA invertase Pin-like site-specific DNA recombinase [Sinorhizobium meliloti]
MLDLLRGNAVKALSKTLLDGTPRQDLRAALYLRVSTGRQAENDLSIPDQRRQATEFCKARGWEVAIEFVDAGLSGTDEKRAELQRLLDLATNGDSPFDVVVVHSFSRFARDHFALEMFVRKLRKHGIRLISITQDLGDDPMSVMVRQVFALFDEYQSKENAKHVLRAMKENARQGFWNGAARKPRNAWLSTPWKPK